MKNSPHALGCLFALFLIGAPLHAETRLFTDTSGRSFQGELIKFTAGFVTIKRSSDGQEFTVKANNFSAEDNAYFAQNNAAAQKSTAGTSAAAVASGTPFRLSLKVSTSKSDRISKGEQFDDKQQVLQLSVDIKNEELKRDLLGANCSIIVLAKQILKPNTFLVVGREEFKVDVPLLKTFHYEQAKPIRLLYDDKNTAQYGYKYYGYICVIKDAGGKVVLSAANPNGNVPYADTALKLCLWDVCNRDMSFLEKGFPIND